MSFFFLFIPAIKKGLTLSDWQANYTHSRQNTYMKICGKFSLNLNVNGCNRYQLTEVLIKLTELLNAKITMDNKNV